MNDTSNKHIVCVGIGILGEQIAKSINDAHAPAIISLPIAIKQMIEEIEPIAYIQEPPDNNRVITKGLSPAKCNRQLNNHIGHVSRKKYWL